MQKFIGRRVFDGVFFVILMIILGGFAKLLHIDVTHPSGNVHLIIQAQAWLHGHLDVGKTQFHDSIILAGKAYIIFPPLPSLLMVPFIAILGDKFSDIWFTWVFA